MGTTVTDIDDENPLIQYAGLWRSFYSSFGHNHTAHTTLDVGAQAIFKFRGSSVSVFGALIRGAAFAPEASHSVDGSDAAVIAGKPAEDRDLLKQLLYTSPELDPFKEHTLVITVIKITENPFHLDYLQIFQEEAADSVPNTPSALRTITTQTVTQSSVTLLSDSQTTSLTFTSPAFISTILSIPVSVANNQSETFSSGLGKTLDPTQAATQSLPSNPPTQNTPSQWNRVIGSAVGGAVGGLILLIMMLILFFVLRRRAKARAYQLSSLRATAFPSTVGYQDITSPTTPTSASPLRRDEPGAGYIVQGGHSTEKKTNRLPGVEWRQSNYQDRGNVISELLPAYQSEFGDVAPGAPSYKGGAD